MTTKLPSSMRAVTYKSVKGGLEKNLNISSIDLPKGSFSLPKNSTLIKIAYSSLNPVDVKVAESIPSFIRANPAIPASDYAGTVVASTISTLKPGDKVFGSLPLPTFGALAEYGIAKGPEACIKIPDGLSLEDAATLGVAGLTAWQSIEPFVKSGSRVLLIGASGGVGTFQIQIAKKLGCYVAAVCSGANAGLCKELGADEIIDYKAVNVIKSLKSEHGGEKGFDLIVDNIFQDFNNFWQAHHYLKATGKYTTIAGAPSLHFLRGFLSCKYLPSWLGGGRRPFEVVLCTPNVKQYEELARWVAEGKITIIKEDTIDVEQISQGYAKIKSGRTRGKIVVRVSNA